MIRVKRNIPTSEVLARGIFPQGLPWGFEFISLESRIVDSAVVSLKAYAYSKGIIVNKHAVL